jgi:uncharacterized MAPEG superfamily protein
MTPELTVLGLAILLHMVLLCLYAVRANLEIGRTYTTGPRDTPPERPLGTTTARLQRAVNNSLESLILFAPAALMVGLTHQSTPDTAAVAWAFLAARLLYIPAYALGLAPWRSAIWGLGFLATLFLTLAALF